MKVAVLQCYSKNTFPMNIGALSIKYFSKTNYSHYALYVEDQAAGEGFYYDSTGVGTRKYRPSVFLKKYRVTKEFKVSKQITYMGWLEFWAKHVNKKYGFVQVLGLLLKITNIVKRNPFGAGAKLIICNELVILFLNEFEYTCIEDTDSLDLNETEKILQKVLQ